jgi:hypothetical protein
MLFECEFAHNVQVATFFRNSGRSSNGKAPRSASSEMIFQLFEALHLNLVLSDRSYRI